MKYKIAKLTQMLDTDSIHVSTITEAEGMPDDIMAGAMQRPEFKGKTVAMAPIYDIFDEGQYLVAVTTECSPVGNPDQFVFAYACVPSSMDLTVGEQLGKLLELQL